MENAVRNSTGSRRIVVEDHEYRWRVKASKWPFPGDDLISIGIWPTNGVGGFICGTMPCDVTYLPCGNGSGTDAGDQIIITNRLIRRAICYAISEHGYDPNRKSSKPIDLPRLDLMIRWDDALRSPFHDPRQQATEILGTPTAAGALARDSGD